MYVPSMIFRRFARAVLVTATPFLAIVGAWADDRIPPTSDPYGDPLPKGALARLGTQRWRHEGDVSFVAYADGGKQMLTSCGDGIVHVWEAKSGKRLRSFGDKLDFKENKGSAMPWDLDDYIDGPAKVRVRLVASPDGKWLACKRVDDPQIQIWEVANGKELRALEPTDQSVIAEFAFTSNSKHLIVQEYNWRPRQSKLHVKLWDVGTGKVVFDREQRVDDDERFGSGSGTGSASAIYRTGFVVSPDGMSAANWEIIYGQGSGAGRADLVIRDLKEDKETKRIKISHEDWEGRYFREFGWSSMFAPDGKRLVTGAPDGSLRLYDLGEGKEILQLEEGKGSGARRREIMEVMIQPQSFSPNGKLLLAQAFDETYRLYDLETGKERHKLGEKSEEVPDFKFRRLWRRSFDPDERPRPSPLAWSPDDKTIAQPHGNLIRLWNVETGKAADIAGHVGEVTGIVPAPDGTSAYTVGADKTYRKWSVDSSKEQQKSELGPGIAQCVPLTPSRSVVIMLSGAMSLWDPIQREEVRSLIKVSEDEHRFGLHFPAENRISVAADHRTVLVADTWSLLHVFDVERGDEARALSTKKNLSIKSFDTDERVRGLACSPDGGLAVVRMDIGGSGSRSGRRFRLPDDEDTTPIKSVIRVYDLKTRQEVWEADAKSPDCRDLAYAPNGRSIALVEGAGNAVALFEAATGKERWRVETAANHCRFSADGLFLALGTEDGGVKLLDARDGTEIATFQGHLGRVSCLAFDADARTLFSGGADGTVLAWNTSAQVAKARSRSAVSPDQIKSSWDDLAKSEASTAYQAIVALSSSPKATLALFKENLKPVKPVEEAQLDKLVAQLDDDDFATREKAFHELARIGERARDALNEALEKDAGPETRKYVEQLLAGLEPATPLPEVLRDLRAIEVLETIATPEARGILEALAKGARGNRLTREAAATLKRLPK